MTANPETVAVDQIGATADGRREWRARIGMPRPASLLEIRHHQSEGH